MRVLDLFCGAGGVACGLDAVGADHVGIEWHELAAAIARAAGHRVVVGDVRDTGMLDDAVRQLGGAPDLVWASPPCQAWSSAGRRLGAQDERNGWPWTLDALDHLGHPPLVAENVVGMLHHSGEHCGDPERCARCYFDRVLIPALQDRYPVVKWRVMDAADVGVPQHRRRVIIQARHDAVRWPALTHGDPSSMFVAAGVRERWRTVRDALGFAVLGGGARGHGLAEWRPRVADASPSPTVTGFGSTGGLYVRAENTGATARSVDAPAPTTGGAGVLYLNGGDPGTRAGSEPGRLDQPSPTVTTTEVKGTRGRHMGERMTSGAMRGGVDRASDAVWLATGRRRLTVVECAALQSFPADYPWGAAGTKSEAYKAVGNAVPPPMAAALVGVYA